MKKDIIVLLFLFCSVLANAQDTIKFIGDAGRIGIGGNVSDRLHIVGRFNDTCHSNNYELYYDSSSKRYIRIELDHIEFMEWVNQYWKKKGEVWANKYREKVTSKQLWLYWYKETNQCWWE